MAKKRDYSLEHEQIIDNTVIHPVEINDEMKLAASEALANLITDEELSPEYIIPKAFDKRVGPAVAKAVAEAAKRTGVARI